MRQLHPALFPDRFRHRLAAVALGSWLGLQVGGAGPAAVPESPARLAAERECAELGPEALIPLLGDERFVVRVSAEARLHRLLHESPAGQINGIERLCLRIYQTTPEPEIRMRARAVLTDYATNLWSPDAFLGVATTATTEFDDALKLRTWLEITKLLPDGPAAKAGLQKGDRIETVDQLPFKEGTAAAQLDAQIAEKHPGDPLTLEIVHDGRRQTVAVTLGCRPRPTKPAGDKPPLTPDECLRQYLSAQHR